MTEPEDGQTLYEWACENKVALKRTLEEKSEEELQDVIDTIIDNNRVSELANWTDITN